MNYSVNLLRETKKLYKLEDGVFPQNMKLADVNSCFQNEDKHLKRNYRPVSILSSISKVFERLIRKQISNFMEDKLSIFLCRYCMEIVIRSEKCGILFTDLPKAFDSLSHELLTLKPSLQLPKQ